jgi:hypothetical protein
MTGRIATCSNSNAQGIKMKRLFHAFLTAILFAGCGISASAQTSATQTIPGYGTTTGCPPSVTYCYFPVGSTPMAGTSQYALTLASAKALTVPTGANGAFITIENNGTYSAGISCTWDGTTPTASTGHEFPAGATFWFARPYLSVLKCIQQSASAAIDVSYAL